MNHTASPDELRRRERLLHVAQRALQAWRLQDAKLQLLTCRENAVYEVRARDGSRWALRLHRPGYQTEAALRSEVAWTKALRTAGVRTARLLPTPEGELLVPIDDAHERAPYLCDLLHWEPGTPLGQSENPGALRNDATERTQTTYQRLGQLAARIHCITETWERPAGFERPHWDLAGCLGDHALWGCWRDLATLTEDDRAVLLPAAHRVQESLQTFGTGPDRYGLVHGDLVPENVLAHGDHLAVLDFDDSGHGWYLWELATAVFWYLGTPHYGPALAGYVEGYRRERALPEEHLRLLPEVLLMRCLVYLGWMQTRRTQPTAVRLNDYLRHVAVRLARPVLAGDAVWHTAPDLGTAPTLPELAATA